jgi:hypothetical protein
VSLGEGKSYSGHGNDSSYHLLKAIKLLSQHREFNSKIFVSELSGLLSGIEFDSGSLRAVGRILSNDALRRTIFHTIDSGAVTLRARVFCITPCGVCDELDLRDGGLPYYTLRLLDWALPFTCAGLFMSLFLSVSVSAPVLHLSAAAVCC